MPQAEQPRAPALVGVAGAVAAIDDAAIRTAVETAAAIREAITPDVMGRLFAMRPVQALKWFQDQGIRISWDWRADWRRSQGHAFTVTKVTNAQVLAAIQEEIASAINDGVTQAQWKARLTGRLRALGWLGGRTVVDPQGRTHTVDLSNPHRLQTIFRTNTQAAYNAGRELSGRELIDAAPFWQYVAVMDKRTRASHAELNGRIYRADDPIWRQIYPPNGFNCRCRVRMLTAKMVERRGLLVVSSREAPLPEGFPDEGFNQDPINDGAREQRAAATEATARQRGQAAVARAQLGRNRDGGT